MKKRHMWTRPKTAGRRGGLRGESEVDTKSNSPQKGRDGKEAEQHRVVQEAAEGGRRRVGTWHGVCVCVCFQLFHGHHFHGWGGGNTFFFFILHLLFPSTHSFSLSPPLTPPSLPLVCTQSCSHRSHHRHGPCYPPRSRLRHPEHPHRSHLPCA